MNRLINRFSKLREKEEGALITYFPIGDPEHDTMELADTYIENGADLLEISLPVPDPYYDGKTVAESMRRILEAGRDIDWIFNEIYRIRKAYPEMPLQLFSYMQIFEQKQLNEFAERCKEVQVDAMLIPEATEEQIRDLEPAFDPEFCQLRFMPYLCDISSIDLIRDRAKGYIFLQAADGMTGARESVEPSLKEKISRLHAEIPDVSICSGFGVSTPEHCRQMMKMGADGVIVGSLIVKTVSQQSLIETGELIKLFKESLRQA